MTRKVETKEAVLNTIVRTIETCRKTWPVTFALTRLTELSGGAWNHRTIHNKRSKGEIPARIFFMNGTRKVMVARDEFLQWWQSELTTAERNRA